MTELVQFVIDLNRNIKDAV